MWAAAARAPVAAAVTDESTVDQTDADPADAVGPVACDVRLRRLLNRRSERAERLIRQRALRRAFRRVRRADGPGEDSLDLLAFVPALPVPR